MVLGLIAIEDESPGKSDSSSDDFDYSSERIEYRGSDIENDVDRISLGSDASSTDNEDSSEPQLVQG